MKQREKTPFYDAITKCTLTHTHRILDYYSMKNICLQTCIIILIRKNANTISTEIFANNKNNSGPSRNTKNPHELIEAIRTKNIAHNTRTEYIK